MSDKIELSVRHKRFADGIMEGETYGSAYQAAGYACKNLEIATQAASRLSRNVKIQEYIRQKQEEERHLNQLRMARMAAKIVARFNKMADDPDVDNRTKYLIGKDILDRAGYKPKEEIELTGNIAINISIPKGVKDDEL